MGFIPTSTLFCALSAFGFPPGIDIPHALVFVGPALESSEASRDQATYLRALDALDEAMLVANTDPEQGIALLNRALSALHQFAPLLALDPAARMRRSLAHLALARAKLARGDEQGAAQSVDATLRELGELELPLDELGPTLARLVEARRGALEELGHGSLRVVCASACEVWIDENPGEAALESEGFDLAVGSHRVWIEDPSGALAPLQTSVELLAGDSTELRYPALVPAPNLVPATPDSDMDRSSPSGTNREGARDRLAPRWAELLGASLGVVTLAAGATLWAIDSHCPGGVDPNDVQACPQLYDTRVAGITTLALGSALVLSSVALLTTDELRLRRRGRGDAEGHARVGLDPRGLALRF